MPVELGGKRIVTHKRSWLGYIVTIPLDRRAWYTSVRVAVSPF